VLEGQLHFDVIADVATKPHDLLQLLVDLPRFATIEPRLVSAAWLPGVPPPNIGARAAARIRVNFSLAFIDRLFGNADVVATILEFDDQTRAVVQAEADGLFGTAVLTDETADGVDRVGVSVTVRLRNAPVRLLAWALREPIEERGRQAILRAIRRADHASDSPATGPAD
jgi:hypothetical protein